MDEFLDNQKTIKNTYDFFRHLLKNRLINDYKPISPLIPNNITNMEYGKSININPDKIINIFHPNIIDLIDKNTINKNINNMNFLSNDGFDLNNQINKNLLTFESDSAGNFKIFDFLDFNKLLVKYDNISYFHSLEYQDNLEHDNYENDNINISSRYSEYTFNKREEKPTFNPIVTRNIINNDKVDNLFNYYYGDNRKEYFKIITDKNNNKNFLSILTATTGSGKTTEIPLFLLEFGFSKFSKVNKKILVTQPRQMATDNPAKYIAFQMDMPRKIIFNSMIYNRRQKLRAIISHFMNYESLNLEFSKENKDNKSNSKNIINKKLNRIEVEKSNGNPHKIEINISNELSDIKENELLKVDYKYLVGNDNGNHVIYTHPTENVYEIIEQEYYIPIYDYYYYNNIGNENDNEIIRSSNNQIKIDLKKNNIKDQNLLRLNKTHIVIKEEKRNRTYYYLLKNYWEKINNMKTIQFSDNYIQNIDDKQINFNENIILGTVNNSFTYYMNKNEKKLYFFEFANYINLVDEKILDGKYIYKGDLEKKIENIEFINTENNKYFYKISLTNNTHSFNYKKKHFCLNSRKLMNEPVLGLDGNYYEKTILLNMINNNNKLIKDKNDILINYELVEDIKKYKKFNKFMINNNNNPIKNEEFQVIDVINDKMFIFESNIDLFSILTSNDLKNYSFNNYKLKSNKIFINGDSDVMYFNDTNNSEFKIYKSDDKISSKKSLFLPYIRIFDPQTDEYKLRYSKILRFKHNCTPKIDIGINEITQKNNKVIITNYVTFIDEPYSPLLYCNGLTITNVYEYNQSFMCFKKLNSITKLDEFIDGLLLGVINLRTLLANNNFTNLFYERVPNGVNENDLSDMFSNELHNKTANIDNIIKYKANILYDALSYFPNGSVPEPKYFKKGNTYKNIQGVNIDIELNAFQIFLQLESYLTNSNYMEVFTNKKINELFVNENFKKIYIKKFKEDIIKLKKDFNNLQKYLQEDIEIFFKKFNFDVIKINGNNYNKLEYSYKDKIGINFEDTTSSTIKVKNELTYYNEYVVDSFYKNNYLLTEKFNLLKIFFENDSDDDIKDIILSKFKIKINNFEKLFFLLPKKLKQYLEDELQNEKNNNFGVIYNLNNIQDLFRYVLFRTLYEGYNNSDENIDFFKLKNIFNIFNILIENNFNNENRKFNVSMFNYNNGPVSLTSTVGVSYQGKYDTVNGNIEKTYLDLATDGSFLNTALNNIITKKNYQLDEYSCILIDEAHERTIASEYLMAILNNYIVKKRTINPFRSIIMSATISTDKFKSYFNTENAHFIKGNTYGKNIFYNNYKSDLNTVILSIIDSILDKSYLRNSNYQIIPEQEQLYKTKDKGILIFLPKQDMIKELSDSITKNPKYKDLKVLSLYRSLSEDTQNDVINKSLNFWISKDNINYKKRIIIATNIAETSVTPKDITYVIDSGLENKKLFNLKNESEILTVMPTSINSIIQRMGRIGRTETGNYFPIFNKDFLDIEYYINTKKTKNNNLKIQMEPKIEVEDSMGELFKLLQSDLISNPSDILNNNFPLLSSPNYELLNYIIRNLEKNKLILINKNKLIINKKYINYFSLDLSFKSIKIIKFVLENNNYRVNLRSILILLFIIDRDVALSGRNSAHSTLFDYSFDWYVNELATFYRFLQQMIDKISIDGYHNNSIFNYFMGLYPKVDGVPDNREIFRQIIKILKVTEKNIETLNSIELKSKNFNHNIYNFNILGFQSKLIFNENFFYNIKMCLIHGYNDNIYKQDSNNKHLYVSINNKNIKYTFFPQSISTKVGKKIKNQLLPEFVYMFKLKSGSKMRIDDDALFYPKKIIKDFYNL